MSLNEDIALLSRVPLFREMNQDPLRLLAFGAERRHLGAGQQLFRQHAPAASAFVIAGGKLELRTATRTGESRLEAIAGPGTLLSEIALVTNVERKFTAIAAEECDIMEISRALFQRLLEEYPEVGLRLEAHIRDSIAALAKAALAMNHRFT